MYTHRAPRLHICVYRCGGGCVYAPCGFTHTRVRIRKRTGGRWVRIHARVVELATCTQVVCVRSGCAYFLGIGRGIRRWVRIRASVTGAYLEPTQGRVSFVQESLLVGLVRIEYGARGGRPTRGPRPHGGPRRRARRIDGPAPHAPQGIWDAVRTLHSADAGGGTFAQPRALSQRPQTAIRESPYGAPRLLCPAARAA